MIEVIIKATADQAAGVIKNITGSLETIGSTATRIGVGLTAVTAPLAAFFATALKEASDSQTVMAQLEATLKSTGGVAGVTADQVTDVAESLAKVTRFGDDAIISTQNLLLTFTSIGKDIFPEVTRTALDMSTALGQDLKSSAMQLGKALNDPITGITALRRVGVQFTDSQEAMIKSLVESGDLMGAQTLILKELQREFGGSAEAAGRTFAGKLDILNNKFGELQESIGFLLMPTLERVVDVVSNVVDSVSEWAEANPELAQTLTTIGVVAVALGPALIVVGSAITAISTISAVATPIIAGLGLSFNMLLGPIGLIIAALAALKLAYDNNFLGFKDTVDGIVASLQWLPGRFEVELNNIAGYFQYYFGIIQTRVDDALTQVGYFIAEHVVIPLQEAWSKIEPYVQDIIDWFDDFLLAKFREVVGWVNEHIIAPMQNIWTTLQPVLANVAGFVVGIFTPVLTFINEVKAKAEALISLLGNLGQLVGIVTNVGTGTGQNPHSSGNPGGGGGTTSGGTDWWYGKDQGFPKPTVPQGGWGAGAMMSGMSNDWISKLLPGTPDLPFAFPTGASPRASARALPSVDGGGGGGTFGGMSSAPQVIFEEGSIVMPGADARQIRGLTERITEVVEDYYMELSDG